MAVKRLDPLALLGLAVAILLLVTSLVPPYGYFIDELYFIACSKRLAWGYVDQPPLSIVLLAAERALLGDGQVAARVLPALAMGATAWITGLTARQLGGRALSQILAAVAVACMPVVQVFGTFYSMNAFEPLIVGAAFLLAVRMVQQGNPRLWLPVGALLGAGLELKHTMALFAAALTGGILVSGPRRLLASRWAAVGLLVCVALILPNLAWQVAHGFPSIELYRNSFTAKNIDKSFGQVIVDQLLVVGPVTLPLWVAGLVHLATPRGRPYRFVLFAYAFLLALMLAAHSSRPDRMTSLYPVLMAFGAVALEQMARGVWAAVLRGYAVAMPVAALVFAPAFCPMLAPADLRPYLASLGLHFDIEAGKKGEPIPQWLADRIGWRELAEAVSRVFRSLPEVERRDAVLASTNYGVAGALELYGPPLGLPRVYATHNSFHSWGPPPAQTRTFVGVDVNIRDVRARFRTVVEAGVYVCPDCTRSQRRIPIYVLRDPLFDVTEAWPGFKNYH
ncbi:MAG TPA: glycosyltransferase family 39 protein [Anaeromyxobacteraceae bacterium]|nr:glycosyltransferase family 39 protein [Anaeromyxobacteraceae bacterium]